jgi:hypothetical protein
VTCLLVHETQIIAGSKEVFVFGFDADEKRIDDSLRAEEDAMRAALLEGVHRRTSDPPRTGFLRPIPFLTLLFTWALTSLVAYCLQVYVLPLLRRN